MKRFCITAMAILIIVGCSNSNSTNVNATKIPVIFDTDANNELDDQHALAYLIFNDDTFNIIGVTTNATYNGGDIDEQHAEAERVIKLCNAEGLFPLLKGANGRFENIVKFIDNENYDGYEAINFIINKALNHKNGKLTVVAVGKLTNVALAVYKEPKIVNKLRLVWLGANYPDPGEYNLENDVSAMNYLLNTSIPFELVTVRYGELSGTDAVRLSKDEVYTKLPGIGITIEEPVTGRHGGEFYNFGDYAVSLFEHTEYYGDPPSRALFDMAAVAIVKNQKWADRSTIPAPRMDDNIWIEQPDNDRKITIWENFDRNEIINDFFNSFK